MQHARAAPEMPPRLSQKLSSAPCSPARSTSLSTALLSLPLVPHQVLRAKGMHLLPGLISLGVFCLVVLSSSIQEHDFHLLLFCPASLVQNVAVHSFTHHVYRSCVSGNHHESGPMKTGGNTREKWWPP